MCFTNAEIIAYINSQKHLLDFGYLKESWNVFNYSCSCCFKTVCLIFWDIWKNVLLSVFFCLTQPVWNHTIAYSYLLMVFHFSFIVASRWVENPYLGHQYFAWICKVKNAIYFCNGKAKFSTALLQYSESHDPSKIILIF